ncbi:MFS transporter [Curtobacterium sp. Leaf261]|uniref:MFS transporter n=1 Tax=Curtobacterium sp. Leaf261 TaxID=1736311 RepID=UPI0006F9D163|nr:MFS transporter [Curtobacterium sp. Leaf261]KQO64982.1 multidrug transporter [Curtobacterium sp. Leaf261]
MTTPIGTTTPDQTSAADPRLRDSWIALAGLSAVFLFEMLDNSILTVALPTIGRDLHAGTLGLQWVTNAYAVVFGGLMLVFGAVADRIGRRRVMLAGLVLLGLASLATAFVTDVGQLVAVRAVMGVAAAMTTPGSISLAFRLFRTEGLRVRAMTLISTVGLVGLAVGPTVGGFVLAVAPWQVLLLVNVPIAVLAFVGIRTGIAADDSADMHRDPADIGGGVLGTVTIVLALVAPTLFVERGVGSWVPWVVAVLAAAAGAFFVRRERSAAHPLLDLTLLARPLVASGLGFRAASGLATAGLGYMVTLQLQLDWGWTPALAAIGLLPQVVVLLGSGPFVSRFVARVGIDRAAAVAAMSVVAGLAVDAGLGRFGYGWVVVALVLVAAGMRVVGVVSGVRVMTGLPSDRTSIGAALVDTASEVTSAVGIAIVGTVLAVLFTGDITSGDWTTAQTGAFREGITIAGFGLTALAGALVLWATTRARAARVEHGVAPAEPEPTTVDA